MFDCVQITKKALLILSILCVLKCVKLFKVYWNSFLLKVYCNLQFQAFHLALLSTAIFPNDSASLLFAQFSGSMSWLHRLFQIAARSEGKSSQWDRESEILLGDFFLMGGGNLRSYFDQSDLFQRSIKTKISMTCVSKQYEIKTKMVHEH